MMTKLFADRLAEYGIQVNEIRPGIIATGMTSTVKEKYDNLNRAKESFRSKKEDLAKELEIIKKGVCNR